MKNRTYSVLIMLAYVSVLSLARAAAQPAPGQIVVDPSNPRWLKYNGAGPFFMCGPGDPEGFLYRGTLNPDGTRSGDQLTLINKLKGTGANSIYLMAVRSHGGDGDSTHNPFIDNDPTQGISTAVLDQWETWFTEMDNSGIVIYFFFYDDSARIWNTGSTVGPEERTFVQTIVNRFEHHKHLIWIVAEEYSEAYSALCASNIAAEIRAADDYDHVIAVHQHSGTLVDFANDPNIDQFAIQYNVSTAGSLHSGMVTAWNNAAGRYNLNMTEAASYGTGATARKKDWAIAMGGTYVMRLGMDIAGTSVADLQDCGRLVSFMQSTNFNQMAPHYELKYGGTEYVFAFPGDSYIAYASALTGNIGLQNMTAGTYDFKWYDVVGGNTVVQTTVSVNDGNQTWAKPATIGNELAAYLKKTGGKTNVPSTANSQNIAVPYNTPVSLTLTYSDPDGPSSYTFIIVDQPTKGTLTGSGANRVYTPNNGANGTDGFTFAVNDGIATSNTATVNITISQDSGVGVNLVWTAIGGLHERLGHRKGGVNTDIVLLRGVNSLSVIADLDTKTFDGKLNGVLVRSALAFDNAVALSSVRFFTDALNEVNFSGRTFDNVEIVLNALTPDTTPPAPQQGLRRLP